MRYLKVEFALTDKGDLDCELLITQQCDSDPAPLF